MNKYNIEIQKRREKDIRRTLMKAGVPKNATPEQIKTRLINYVSGLTNDFQKLAFSDELLADPNFLLDLYRANINMVDFQSPDPKNKELQDNVDFMIEYVKLKHSKEMQKDISGERHWVQTSLDWPQIYLEWATEKYDTAMTNPKFIVKLAETFPNQEIIPIVRKSICKTSYDFDKEKKNLARYKECLSNLPIEFICDQVRKSSERTLNDIPNDIANFNQIVGAGIDANGFKSLNKLNITQVLDNVDLVVKAYEKDGIQKLSEYIQYTLSPERTHHDEEHTYTAYDKRYKEVQDSLITSPKIQAIFKREKLIAKIKEIKTTHLPIEPYKNEENILIK